MKDQIKKPRPELAARLDREVKKRWQPQIRAKARAKAASTGGIVIDARAQEIAAEALKEVYFQDGGRRAGSLEEVRFTDIEHLEFDL